MKFVKRLIILIPIWLIFIICIPPMLLMGADELPVVGDWVENMMNWAEKGGVCDS